MANPLEQTSTVTANSCCALSSVKELLSSGWNKVSSVVGPVFSYIKAWGGAFALMGLGLYKQAYANHQIATILGTAAFALGVGLLVQHFFFNHSKEATPPGKPDTAPTVKK